MHDSDERAARRFVTLGSGIRYARLGRARGSVGRGARLGRDACAHGRVHGSVATHDLVAQGDLGKIVCVFGRVHISGVHLGGL